MQERKLIRTLIFTACYLPGYKGGGPIKTIKNLVERLGKEVSFRLVTSDRDLGDSSPYTGVKCGVWNTVGNAEVFYAEPGKVGYKRIFNILANKSYDIIYLNSFFSFRFSILPLLLAKRYRQKVILAPRGELSQGALVLKPLKKQFFIKLYKLLQLHRGTVFQASSSYEVDDIKRVLGSKVDTYIAENIGSQDFAEELSTRQSSTLKAVFISRISPKKNLLVALKILNSVAQPLSYDIYGPIEDIEYWKECLNVIRSLPKHIKVMYKGELTPDQVVPMLSQYDFFFMPTKGENYGHVIAEALCAGLPLLIADTTPWRNLQEQVIGWDLPLSNPDAFSAAIDQLAMMPAAEHHQMRQAVLAWAKNKFSQRDAVEANIAMFRYAYEKK